jgi:GT2 family glycosyltransferase
VTARTVSVVIPTWEGRDLLARHLPGTLGAAAAVGAEVVVVDDGSRDDSVGFVRERFPSVKVVARARNGGFSAAMNDGVRAAGGAIVVCLNNDVEPTPDFLAPLVRHFDDPSCFAVGARSLMPDGTDESFLRGAFHRGALQIHRAPSPPAAAKAMPVLYAMGAAVAYSREKFLALGGFDLLFSPFNGEDLDISYRAWKRGWRVLWEPASVVRHEHRTTIRRHYSTAFVRKTQARGRLLVTWKDVTDPWLTLAHVLWLGPRTLAHLARGERYFVAAVWSCLRDLPAIRRARRAEARHAVRSDRDVLAEVAPL